MTFEWPMLAAGLSGLVWLVRLEGRINVQEALLKEQKDKLLEIRSDLNEIKTDVKELLKK